MYRCSESDIELLTKFYDNNLKDKDNVVSLDIWLGKITVQVTPYLPIELVLKLLESSTIENFTPYFQPVRGLHE